MDWKNIIGGLLGGLGVFLFGMHLLTEALQRVAGDRLKNILAFLTKNRFMGVALGALVTAAVQSSSATTVMMVGFVNAGIMDLTQVISVIMGANIGSTITAQIIAFKITELALPLIFVGAMIHLFSKDKRWKFYGQVVLGLGMLFFGIELMAMGVMPLKGHQGVADFFRRFSNNPATAVLAGVIMTCILQSSAATIGVAIVLAQQGLIDFNGAIPLIVGDNIGTTITAQLAALNASRAARRAAMSHTIFNIFGAIIVMPFVITGLYQKLIAAITPGDPANTAHIARFIANSHTTFNVLNTLLFLGFINVLKTMSIWIVPVKPDEVKKVTSLLEPRLLDTPAIALDLIRREMVRMLEIARDSVRNGLGAIIENSPAKAALTRKIEDATDEYQRAITRYLIALSERDLTSNESEQIPTLLHSVNDIERVGDMAQNLAETADFLMTRKFVFSPQAVKNLEDMGALVDNMFTPLMKAVGEGKPEFALEVLALEKKVNAMCRQCDEEHLDRMRTGICLLPSATCFTDAMHFLEKIGDHLKNVAQTAHNMFTYSRGKAHLPKEPGEDKVGNLSL